MENILLQAAQSQGGTSMIIMIVAFIAIFYLFMIRPQQKKQKNIQKAREALQVGDKVVTSGGIHGKIKDVGDTYFIIQVAEGIKITFEKSAVFPMASDTPESK